MELTLKRELIFPDAIHGKIYYRNKPVCCTLEKPNHCLVAGTYRMRLEKVNEEDEYLTPCLYRTNSEVYRVMCTITKGNGLRNLRSYTIFAGKYQCRGLVIQGDKYLKRLNELIATKKENEKEKIYLMIEDPLNPP
ncbi:MAG: hypothetical protein KBT15_00220 [Bacteroidales bacterium]|nr:hypothetical protein [Candidatus Minthousia equi]